MHSRRPSRYKLITFIVAAIAGMVGADLLFPDPGSAANLLTAGGIAAVVALLMVWAGSRREKDDEQPPDN